GTDLERLDVSTFDGNDSINLSHFTALPTRIDAGAGDDTVTGSPQADVVDGGPGNDSLHGGPGNDALFGGDGDDQLFGGTGSDTFPWGPGDGNDLIEGQDGVDLAAVNGSAGADAFALSSRGSRLRVDAPGGAVLDAGGVEQVALGGLGGPDGFTINDLSPTEVTDVRLDLGAGDGAADAAVVN